MAYDNFRVIFVKAKEFNRTFRNKAVGGSVETISSYFVVLVIFQWKAIEICFCRHRLMESGIKYTNLRYSWHKLRAYTDTDQVCRVMKRCKIVALFYCCNHFICDYYRFGKFLTTMYNTVSNSVYFFQASDSACFVICKGIQNHLDCFFMCRHGSFCNFFVTACFLIY